VHESSTDVSRIVAAALNIAPGAARQAFVAGACAGDEALRQKVEARLREHGPGGEKDDTLPRTGANACACLEPSTQPGSLGRLAHYEVLEVLGSGGFGTVFRAFDERLQRPVAIKMLAPELAASLTARQRFLREARVTARLRHEHVVTVHAVEGEPVPFLVMEFVPGTTLQQRVEQGPLPLRDILRVGQQIARGLAAAHAQGLIHRDIKPANVLLESDGGRVKITDFGLARAVDDGSLSQSGTVAGTPLYMAPEQARGEPLDNRADLFSLGSTLYAMATGQPPFHAAGSVAIMYRVVEETPRSLHLVNGAIPPWLEAIINRLLAKKPADRYQSALEVADLLAGHSADLQPPPAHGADTPAAADTLRLPGRAARPKPDRVPAPQPRRPRRATAIGLALLLGALVGGAAYAIYELAFNAPNRTAPGPVEVGDGKKKQAPVEGDDGKKKQAAPITDRTKFTNSLGMRFTLVPKGTVKLGGGGGRIGDEEFTVPQDFFLGVYEVTQEEWETLMGKENNPSQFARRGTRKAAVVDFSDEELKRFPVDSVSWDQCQEFLRRLNDKTRETGWTYRLPTADEWEYACRGGPGQNEEAYGYDFYLATPARKLPPDWANYKESGLNRTRKVGSYPPNRLGLHDMHGNVFEVCEDQVIRDGDFRSRLVGGGWMDDEEHCQANGRYVGFPNAGHYGCGLRVARVPAPER
jgi:formylglycine-generating enzyme required for sulfatase activity